MRRGRLAGTFALLGALVGLRPIFDVDLFTFLRLGQLDLQAQRMVTTETLTFSHFGDHFVQVHWLANILFALLESAGGLRLVQAVCVLAMVFAWAVAAGTRLDGSREIHVAAAGCAGLASLTSCDARPQALAILAFAILTRLLNRPASIRSGAAITVVAIAWQNAHPSLGIAIPYLLGLALARRLVRNDDWAAGWRWLPLALWLALLQIFTPAGLQAFSVLARNARISREMLGISEWQPALDPAARHAMLPFFVALAIAVYAAWRARRRPDLLLAGACLMLPFTAAAFWAARFAAFWAVAVAPVLAGWFEVSRETERKPQRSHGLLLASAAMLLGYLLTSLQRPAIRPEIPQACIESLRASGIRGRIYNYREWGGPLVWFGDPTWQIAIDGRLYLFSDQEWHSYLAAATGRLALAQIASRYHPDAFVLRPSHDGALIAQLSAASDWKLLVDTDTCVAFGKN